MSSNHFPTDKSTEKIRSVLEHEYQIAHPHAKIDVYRYNPAAIRIRIVDPDFTGKSKSERNDEVWQSLDMLPDELVGEITVCLLLTPDEQPSSLMNLEFENPQPSVI